MNKFNNAVYHILEQITKQEMADLQTKMASFGEGAQDAAIRRAAMLASQGRASEARGMIGQYVKDPEKLKIVLKAMDERLKPIPGATSSKLDQNPKYTEWLDNVWVPWVKKYM